MTTERPTPGAARRLADAVALAPRDRRLDPSLGSTGAAADLAGGPARFEPVAVDDVPTGWAPFGRGIWPPGDGFDADRFLVKGTGRRSYAALELVPARWAGPRRGPPPVPCAARHHPRPGQLRAHRGQRAHRPPPDRDQCDEHGGGVDGRAVTPLRIRVGSQRLGETQPARPGGEPCGPSGQWGSRPPPTLPASSSSRTCSLPPTDCDHPPWPHRTPVIVPAAHTAVSGSSVRAGLALPLAQPSTTRLSRHLQLTVSMFGWSSPDI